MSTGKLVGVILGVLVIVVALGLIGSFGSMKTLTTTTTITKTSYITTLGKVDVKVLEDGSYFFEARSRSPRPTHRCSS